MEEGENSNTDPFPFTRVMFSKVTLLDVKEKDSELSECVRAAEVDEEVREMRGEFSSVKLEKSVLSHSSFPFPIFRRLSERRKPPSDAE